MTLIKRYGRMLSLLLAAVMLLSRSADAQEPPNPDAAGAVSQTPEVEAHDNPDEEILLRGPLHEAFAAPIDYDPKPGLVVPKKPPEPINELPAEVKSDGDAIWIPGYWAWDDEKEDYIWISGVYRKVPQKRRWIPGYWSRVDEGYQWTQGLWAPVETTELEYLPEPPASQERGPSSPSPSNDHFWVSGNWVNQNDAYAWQPGYWSPGYENWCWVPNSYHWTPSGYVYVPGYWDYRLADRGVCYAPVYYRQPIYLQPGYSYWPRTLLNLGWLHMHLFARPRYRHYYYGDWYGRHPRFGLYPVYAYHGRFGYAPAWNYISWHFGRRGINYGNRIRDWHRYYDTHHNYRPGRTLRDQQNFIARNQNYKYLKQVSLADNVNTVLARNDRRFQRVNQTQRDLFRSRSREFDRITQARRQEGSRLPVIAGRNQSQRTTPFRGNNTNRLKLPDTSRVVSARRNIELERTRNLNRSALAGNRARPEFNNNRSRVRQFNEQQDRARDVIRRFNHQRPPSINNNTLPNLNRSQTQFRGQNPSRGQSQFNFRSPSSFGQPRSSFRNSSPSRSNSFNRPSSPSFNRPRSGSARPSFNRSMNRSFTPSFNRGSSSLNRSSGNRSLNRSRSGSFNRSRGGSSFGRGGSFGRSSGGSRSRGRR